MSETETFHWNATYERACDLFGSTPNAEQEQTVLDEFRERPRFVVDQIEKLAGQVQSGAVRSGWAVLRKILSSSHPVNITVTDSSERLRRIENAKRWLRNAGHYLDREADVAAALFEDGFGDLGQSLRDYANDSRLREKLLTLWREFRPTGEQLEREAEEYMASVAAKREEVKAALAKKRPVTNPDGLTEAEAGKCADCEKDAPRFVYGQFLLCSDCALRRQKVARRLARERLPGDLETLKAGDILGG